VGSPSREEIEAVMCALYEFCPGPGCHVASEKVRRAARMTRGQVQHCVELAYPEGAGLV